MQIGDVYIADYNVMQNVDVFIADYMQIIERLQDATGVKACNNMTKVDYPVTISFPLISWILFKIRLLQLVYCATEVTMIKSWNLKFKIT